MDYLKKCSDVKLLFWNRTLSVDNFEDFLNATHVVLCNSKKYEQFKASQRFALIFATFWVSTVRVHPWHIRVPSHLCSFRVPQLCSIQSLPSCWLCFTVWKVHGGAGCESSRHRSWSGKIFGLHVICCCFCHSYILSIPYTLPCALLRIQTARNRHCVGSGDRDVVGLGGEEGV